MQKSLGRYLFAKLALGVAILNVIINAVVGWAIYRHLESVPIKGDLSIAGDTVVGAFLIAFFTLLGVVPAARHEARAGRVPGLGRAPRGVMSWPARRRGWSALGFGVVAAVVLGIGAVAVLGAAGVTELPYAEFLAFKVGFAGAVGAIAAVAGGLAGVWAEPRLLDDPRWCRDPDAPVAGPVYPCDCVDKGSIVLTSAEHGCSGTPTWQLIVRGRLKPDHVRTAVADLLRRYPSLATRVQSLDGRPEHAKRLRYAHDPAIDTDAIFDVVDLRDAPASALDELVAERLNRHTDVFRDPLVTLTMAITGDEDCRLLFRQHHAIADGRAFIELLEDFAAYVNAARAGRRPAPEALEPIGRRPELDALGLTPWRRRRLRLRGFLWLIGSAYRTIFRPVQPLLQNDSNDYTGANGTVHWCVSDEALEGWKPARRRMGVSLNSLLTGALFAANERWHRELGRPVGRTNITMVMETRPRDGSFRSFANHLATLDAEIDLGPGPSVEAIARSIQEQVVAQRDASQPIRRLLCEHTLVDSMTVSQLQEHIFENERVIYNLNFSNLIPLPFPALEGDGWVAEEVLITTPVTPRNGVVLTAIRYRGRLVFNFNFVASAVTREQTTALVRHFRDVLREATEHEAVELPSACGTVDAAAASAA